MDRLSAATRVRGHDIAHRDRRRRSPSAPAIMGRPRRLSPDARSRSPAGAPPARAFSTSAREPAFSLIGAATAVSNYWVSRLRHRSGLGCRPRREGTPVAMAPAPSSDPAARGRPDPSVADAGGAPLISLFAILWRRPLCAPGPRVAAPRPTLGADIILSGLSRARCPRRAFSLPPAGHGAGQAPRSRRLGHAADAEALRMECNHRKPSRPRVPPASCGNNTTSLCRGWVAGTNVTCS